MIKKFSEYVAEDYTVVGYQSQYPGTSTWAATPQTGYNMEPVMYQIDSVADNLAEEAHSYHNDEDEGHTGEGYMREAMKSLHDRIQEKYQNKMGNKLPLINDVFDPRYKGSDVAEY